MYSIKIENANCLVLYRLNNLEFYVGQPFSYLPTRMFKTIIFAK